MKRELTPPCPLKTGARSRASLSGWLPRHQPAMLASSRKRPSISSRFTIAASPSGRQIHCLSDQERRLAYLMLYHPDVFEVWDQCALDVNPGHHPLSDHPLAPSLRKSSHDGTLRLAHQMNELKSHPVEYAVCPKTGESKWVPRNWITDFLLFLHPEGDEPYCVVWDIKSARGLHGLPGPCGPIEQRKLRNIKKALVRQRVHDTYFDQLGIPVKFLSGDQVEDTVIVNLERMCAWASREVRLDRSHVEDLAGGFQEALQAGVPPFAHRKTCTPQQIEQENRVLFSAIWHRLLRVDLFTPVLVDHPLVPETTDVLDKYASWFSKE